MDSSELFKQNHHKKDYFIKKIKPASEGAIKQYNQYNLLFNE